MPVEVGATPEWRQRLAELGLGSLSELLNGGDVPRALAGQVEPLSKPGLGGRRRYRWTGRTPDGPRQLYVKCYSRPGLRAQLDRIRRQHARHSRAWWEYQCAIELSQVAIRVARPVAYVEEMRGRAERRSALVLEAAPGDAFDRTWQRLLEVRSPLTRGRLRQDLVMRLGRFVAAFHSTGWCHRDLYLCHVFMDVSPDGTSAPRFTLIDLGRAHRPKLRRLRWIIKDLSQLDSSARQAGLSRTDRLRFLLAYLGLQRGSRRVRWYARCIVRKADKILARLARKGVA